MTGPAEIVEYPKRIDAWAGTIDYLNDNDSSLSVSLFYPPTPDLVTYAHYEELVISMDNIPEIQRELARKALEFTCTVELADDHNSIVNISGFNFKQPDSMGPKSFELAKKEFGFLANIPEEI